MATTESTDLMSENAVDITNDDTDKWDIVIVMDNILPPKGKDGQAKDEGAKVMKKYKDLQEKRKELYHKLRDPNGAGLRVQRVKVDKAGNARMFLLITADDERLEVEAERLGLSLKLKPQYGGAYSEFEISKKALFEANDPEKGNFFRKTQKFQLIESIIEAPDTEQGAGQSISSLLKRGIINKIYPLHEKDRKKWLIDNWAAPKNLFKRQPIHEIRAYFGEELAIYFAWLGFYTNWLYLSSAVGICCFIIWLIARYNDGSEGWRVASGWVQAIYSIFLALWATFFLEFWKRYQNTLSHQWGMDSFEEGERPRAEYAGVKKPGLYYHGHWIQPPWGAPVEDKKNILENIGENLGVGKEMAEMKSAFEGEKIENTEVEINDIPTPETEYFPTPARNRRIGAGGPVIISFLIIVVIATVSVLSFRLFVANQKGLSAFGSFLGGIINAVVIMIMNNFWKRVAEWLTRWENHRTMTSYYDQLIFKMFAFQFVNSYTSLYYIAFFKESSRIWGRLKDTCKPSLGRDDTRGENLGAGCLDDLMVQLITLLAVNIIVGQTKEVGMPWLMSKIRFILYKRATHLEADEEGKLPQYQKEAAFAPYQGTFDEYNEMVLQYGFVTLFACAFPLAPFLALFNNVIEVRTDAIKFLTGTNRPLYRGAQDIGTWYYILEIIGTIAVITNCLLIGFALIPLFKLFDIEVPPEENRSPTLAPGEPLITKFNCPDDILLRAEGYYILATIVVLEHVIFGVKFAIAALIPDQPGLVRKAIAKQEYIKEQTYKKYTTRAVPRTWNNDQPADKELKDDES